MPRRRTATNKSAYQIPKQPLTNSLLIFCRSTTQHHTPYFDWNAAQNFYTCKNKYTLAPMPIPCVLTTKQRVDAFNNLLVEVRKCLILFRQIVLTNETKWVEKRELQPLTWEQIDHGCFV